MIPLAQDERYLWLKYAAAPILSGMVAWVILLVVGETPLVRAAGMALVVVGMALALRRMGSVIAFIGSLTLAVSPAFWSQTGGGQGEPATIVIALIAAVFVVATAVLISKRPMIGLTLGVVIFIAFLMSQIGTPRSLRLTSFVASWLLFLLIDMLLLTNPRPDDAPPILLGQNTLAHDKPPKARPYHVGGLLILFGVGVLNDPLLFFLAPAMVLALWLTHTELPTWYWGALMLIVGVGLRGFAVDYLQNQAHWVVLDQWRHGQRWLDLVELVIGQFSIIGIILGVLGLARLSRWYPPLGATSMVAYGAYAFFALIYTGPNEAILLLPLLFIQVIWMSYAVFTLSEWLAKSFRHPQLRWLVWGGYAMMPITLLFAILA